MLAATRPEAAAIIQAAAQAHAVGSAERIAQLRSDLAATLGEERARELRARGADMEWDQAIGYALAQITQALSELEPQTQPERALGGPFHKRMALLLALVGRKYIRKILITSRDGRI